MNRLQSVPLVGPSDPQWKQSYTRGVYRRTQLSFASLFTAVGLLTVAFGSAAKPPAVKPAAAAPAPSAAAPAAPATPETEEGAEPAAPTESPSVRARQGVVVIERAGKAIGLGSVLDGDGRILTALSVAGHGNDLEARLPDGTTQKLRVGHSDRGWDLALLIPQNARWKTGLKASKKADMTGQLSSFSLLGGQVVPARLMVKGQKALMGGDSVLLREALELTSKLAAGDVGGPILDEKGDVVGLVARACVPVPNAPCVRVPYGVPVSAAKTFLRGAPKAAVPPAPWLGVRGVAEDAGAVRGVRLTGIHPQSPAASAGLRAGADKAAADVVVAVNDVPVLTPDGLAQAVSTRGVGDTVELLLFGDGKFRRVTLTLKASPDAAPAAKGVAPAAKAAPAVKPAAAVAERD